MNKKIIYGLLMGIIFLGIAFRLLSLNKDISCEETDFVNPAIAITQTGHPLFYQAEQAPHELAVWHPPMYVYFLSGIIRLSTSEVAIRFLNVFFILITGFLIFYFSKELAEKKGDFIGLMASALFLINYYALSSSLLIDLDASSTLFTFSFVGFSLLYFKKNKKVFGFLAGISFLFALGNRYPIAIVTYLGIFLYLAINKETRAYWKGYFIIGFISSLTFLTIWTFYSSIIEPGTFFRFLIHNAQLSSQQFSNMIVYISSFLLNFAQITRLFTIPALLLFLFAFIHGLGKKSIFTRTILIYTFVIFCLFLLVPRPAFGYPRYFFTLLPGFFILIAEFVYDKLSVIKLQKEHLIFLIVCFLASLILLVILNPEATIYRNDGLIKSTNLPDLILNIACILPIGLVFLFKKEHRKVVFILALIGIFFSYNLYFDGKYLGNDSKIKEVGNYLKENTNSSDIVVCPKAVGYYYGGRFYANDYYKPPINSISKEFILRYIAESYENPKMDSEFFWGNDPYGGVYYSNYTQTDENLFNSKYVVLNYRLSDRIPETVIGDYYIYRIKE
jgi:hypothetical protein